MTQECPSPECAVVTTDAESLQTRLRRYAIRVTLALIVVCNGIFLFGMWVSGVNLDELVKSPDQFSPQNDVCLRLTWQRLKGAADPIRLCSEWINLSDPSGKPHVLDQNTAVKQGPDGRYYIDRGIKADYRLVGFVLFIVAVIMFGMATRRFLVNRYRHQLELAATRQSV
ncbi:MAG: hypothetical protein U0412_07385 [Nitrospira sp.]